MASNLADNDPPTDISLLRPQHPNDAMHEPVEGLRRANSPVDPRPATPKPSKTQSPGLNRPPKPPGDLLGPYFHFNTTTVSDQRWHGSALVMHRKGTPTPKLSFEYDVQQQCTTLYDDVFGLTALRFDISMPIPNGFGDQTVPWKLEYRGEYSHNVFNIPKWDQKWRGGFFSCNGFDETVPQETVEMLGFDNVWKHLNSVHKESPMHLLIWGGDQIYIDFIFEDIPFLKRWLKFDWDTKWKHEFSAETSNQVAEYYFNTYHETWERDEVRQALQQVPSLMMWDDHDIFDGAGSYPPELHDSPVMLGLFRSAKKFRLLFQHHTTEDLASSHRFFGVQAQNYIGQCGPRMAIICPDGRSERNHQQVHEKKSIEMIFDKLDKDLAPTTQQLIVVFAVPFSFIRVKVAEKLFAFLKNRNAWIRKLPGLKGTNSIFDLPELYDDLLDEWCHESHINERNYMLGKLQDFAKAKNIRVNLFSGDVHCHAFAMFRSDKATRKAQNLKPENDHRLMYQVISSAIVNQAPSPNACIGYHYIANAWHPIDDTDESLVEMFERRPEHGKHVRHRKVMPNRGWTYFEEVGNTTPGSYGGIDKENRHQYQGSNDGTANTGEGVNNTEPNGRDTEKHHHPHLRHHKAGAEEARSLDWHRENYAFDKRKGYPSTLGPTSAPNGLGTVGKPEHEHSHGLFCHHRNSKLIHKKGSGKQMQGGVVADNGNESAEPQSGLRIRMWLESRIKEEAGRAFSSYECIVPNLLAIEGKKA